MWSDCQPDEIFHGNEILVLLRSSTQLGNLHHLSKAKRFNEIECASERYLKQFVSWTYRILFSTHGMIYPSLDFASSIGTSIHISLSSCPCISQRRSRLFITMGQHGTRNSFSMGFLLFSVDHLPSNVILNSPNTVHLRFNRLVMVFANQTRSLWPTVRPVIICVRCPQHDRQSKAWISPE